MRWWRVWKRCGTRSHIAGLPWSPVCTRAAAVARVEHRSEPCLEGARHRLVPALARRRLLRCARPLKRFLSDKTFIIGVAKHGRKSSAQSARFLDIIHGEV